jgi:hypothetical protein
MTLITFVYDKKQLQNDSTMTLKMGSSRPAK